VGGGGGGGGGAPGAPRPLDPLVINISGKLMNM